MEYLRSAYDLPLLSEPGEKWAYSNFGYFVLAEVIASATGQPWSQFVAEQVFTPLGMTASRALDYTDIVPNRAAGYIFRDGRQSNTRPLYSHNPGGAFMSTISDMVKWESAMSNTTLISRESQDLMWTPVTLADGTSTGYGYGWTIDEVAGQRRIRHGGYMPGYRAEYSRFPDAGLSVILLINSNGGRPRAIAAEIASYYMQGLGPRRVAIEIAPQVLARYAGRYAGLADNVLTIEVDGPGLSVQSGADSAQARMIPENETTFFVSRDENYEFGFNDEGVVDHLIISYGDGEGFRFEKLGSDHN